MPLTTHIVGRVAANHTEANDLATAVDPLDLRAVIDLASGTGANQADLVFHDTRSTDTNGETLDLDALTDAFGDTTNFARVKVIYIKASSSNTGNVIVGGGDFATWVGDSTDVVVIRPGGFMLLAAPDATAYAVTASTGDGLFIDSSSGTVAYDIVIVGASA